MRPILVATAAVLLGLPSVGCSAVEDAIAALVVSQIGCLVDPTTGSEWLASLATWVGGFFAGL